LKYEEKYFPKDSSKSEVMIQIIKDNEDFATKSSKFM
jgi:hypothetical protein